MAEENGDIITLIDEKINQDADFQSSLENLSEEDKSKAISEKKAEMIKTEYSNLAEKAKKDAELAQNYKIRAEKAEDERKKNLQTENKINEPQLSDELKLIARGLSDEAIEMAKVVAKGKGISLPEAIKDPLFIVFDKDLKEKEEKESAKLGASKGSKEKEEKISGLESGTSREKHQEAFKKALEK